MDRKLSGIYFRAKDEDGNWIPRCFEDLTREEQITTLKDKDPEFIIGLAICLAEILKEIGDTFDIVVQREE